jgi:hypothetical protein
MKLIEKQKYLNLINLKIIFSNHNNFENSLKKFHLYNHLSKQF